MEIYRGEPGFIVVELRSIDDVCAVKVELKFFVYAFYGRHREFRRRLNCY